MKKEYCLTYQYPGVCWAYKTKGRHPRVFFECDEHYNMLNKRIKGVVTLTFKQWYKPKI